MEPNCSQHINYLDLEEASSKNLSNIYVSKNNEIYLLKIYIIYLYLLPKFIATT